MATRVRGAAGVFSDRLNILFEENPLDPISRFSVIENIPGFLTF